MAEQDLKAYVEQADTNIVRVRVTDASLKSALEHHGVTATVDPGVYAREISDDRHKAQLFDALRKLGVAFANGKEWCPAEVFEHLRGMHLLCGKFTRVSWRKPGVFHLDEV